MVFVLVNLSLIWLRYKSTNVVREFKSPINVGKFPVLAVLGIVTPIIGVIHLSAFVIIMGFTVVGSGAFFYFIYTRIISKRKQIM
jgi:APA family basic amino acid/polyamine antiporter